MSLSYQLFLILLSFRGLESQEEGPACTGPGCTEPWTTNITETPPEGAVNGSVNGPTPVPMPGSQTNGTGGRQVNFDIINCTGCTFNSRSRKSRQRENAGQYAKFKSTMPTKNQNIL